MKKVKTNPLMMEQKRIKGLNAKGSDNENEIKTFIIIVLVISVLVGGIYALTEVLKKDENTKEETVAGKINYDRISIGMLLNRPYGEYYVMIYDVNDSESILYSTLMSKYMNNKSDSEYIKIYYCDLGNKINSKYYNVNNDNKSNPNAKDISELDLGNLTLIKVKNGKIVSYIEDYDKIAEILK